MGSIPVRLTKGDKEYIDKKGLDTIKSHAYDFISKRLAPKMPSGIRCPRRGS